MNEGTHPDSLTATSVTVPDEQIARQAVASLGGYVHQIVRTVGEWIRLPHDGKLLIEVAEDYATLVRDVLTMSQIKAVSGPNTTLRSDGPRKAIASLIQFQDANPDLEVRLVYLTMADSGREDGSDLPAQQGGIAYWRQAARGADIEPLRKLLLDTQVDPAIKAFVRQASIKDILSVKWQKSYGFLLCLIAPDHFNFRPLTAKTRVRVP